MDADDTLAAMQRILDEALAQLAHQQDEILREAAEIRLLGIQEELRALAAGKVIFSGTEAWRTVYERLLRSPGLSFYRSVAWLRNEDYWQDAPGRHSMGLNYELVERGVRIERVVILSDFFWPRAALLPAGDICRRIDEQHQRGIWVGLVRESEIEAEPELLCDFGIYGDRAAGWLELDNQCRTTRFTFDFSYESIALAQERWRRLLLYAVSYAELLDRAERGA